MESTPPRSASHWLKPARLWHTRAGVCTALFLALIAATGIALNHKDLIFGKEKEKRERGPGGAKSLAGESSSDAQPLRTSATAAEFGGLFSGLIDVARPRWGDRAIERIEISVREGRIEGHVKLADGSEAMAIHAAGRWEFRDPDATETAETGKGKNRPTDWKKLIKDLHTGKVAGEWGKLISDATAVVLIFLTASGFYLWYRPKLLKRAKQVSRREGGAFHDMGKRGEVQESKDETRHETVARR